jgi:LysR family transcriptional activator of nhaA
MLRRNLDVWLHAQRIQPQIVAECEDLALMKVMAAEGRGFIAVPTVAFEEAVKRFHFQLIGHAEDCRLRFHAITADRRIHHPATAAITANAKALLKS